MVAARTLEKRFQEVVISRVVLASLTPAYLKCLTLVAREVSGQRDSDRSNTGPSKLLLAVLWGVRSYLPR